MNEKYIPVAEGAWAKDHSGEWHFYVMAGGTLYIDGEPCPQQDNYMLFDRALTPEEIMALYRAGAPKPPLFRDAAGKLQEALG